MQSRLATIARWCLIVVLAFAGGAKLLMPDRLADALQYGAMVPEPFIGPLAWVLPVVELALAVLLALRRGDLVALPLTVFISAVFTGVHGYTQWKGIVLSCSCFGGLPEVQAARETNLAMLVVSAVMLVSSLVLLSVQPKSAVQ
ncbi:MAG: MauE/DoxX family redox-associated membrane protein [Phycisphaerae bacterium]